MFGVGKSIQPGDSEPTKFDIPHNGMRDLTPNIARHDDSTSVQHQIDKAGKKIRDRIEYKATPALAREAGSRLVEPCFNSPIKGYSFKILQGRAGIVDGEKYTEEIIKISDDLARCKRIRIRNGKERVDYVQFKAGVSSLVTTVAPWHVKILERLNPEDRQQLLLHLVEVQTETIKRISDRPTYGGGIHLDTALPHFHLHVQKTDWDNTVYPKAKFLTAGPWTVGAYRINNKFPNLLSEQKKRMLESNLERKDTTHLVDLHVALELDEAMEAWIRKKGLLVKYEADCEEYERRKAKVQKDEKHHALMSAALERFVVDGIWPIAYRAMTLAMYRMIPKELRGAIMLAIRATQIVKRPVATLAKMAINAALLPAQPEIKMERPMMR